MNDVRSRPAQAKYKMTREDEQCSIITFQLGVGMTIL